jgi:hypothetical protein
MCSGTNPTNTRGELVCSGTNPTNTGGELVCSGTNPTNTGGELVCSRANPTNTGGELVCSGKLSRPCSTSGTRQKKKKKKKKTTENQNNEQHGPTKLDVCFYFSNVYSNIQIGQKKTSFTSNLENHFIFL